MIEESVIVKEGHVERPEIDATFICATEPGTALPALNIVRFTHQKQLGQAAGVWELALDFSAYKPSAKWDEHWGTVLVPMDFLEVKMKRKDLDKKAGTVLRGFVDSVRVQESVQNNKPQRLVVVSGRDWLGKAWAITRFISIYPDNIPTTSVVKEYQIKTGEQPLKLFWQNLIEQTVGLFLNHTMKRLGISQDRVSWGVDADEIDSALVLEVSPAMDISGPIYAIAKSYIDEPWMEMFTEDRDNDASYFVLRWSKLRWSDGRLLTGLLKKGKEPEHHDIVHTLTPSFAATLSDNEVINWFYTTTNLGVGANQSPLDFNSKANPWPIGRSIDKYAFRPVRLQIKQRVKQGEHIAEIDSTKEENIKLLEAMNEWAARALGYAWALKSGSCQVKGRWFYRIGQEILDYTPRPAVRYYLVGVQHEWEFGKPNLVTLSLIRGMDAERGIGPVDETTPNELPLSTMPQDALDAATEQYNARRGTGSRASTPDTVGQRP